MNKNKKNEYMNKKSVAYYSGFNGIEIKDIEYGIDDYIIYCDNCWYDHNHSTVHKSKIYSNKNGDSYFRYKNYRIYLFDCIRTNIF